MKYRPGGVIEMSDQDSTRQDIICPFCEDEDFDLIGLKLHINRGWCEVFEKLETDRKYRLVFNKLTKKIDKIRNYDGLVVDSFNPPEELLK